MACLSCSDDSRVIDSRWSAGLGAVRRRRACRSCPNRWTTVEIPRDVLVALEKESQAFAKLRRLVAEVPDA
jgi:transcriptional regulator NrdR family protein